MSTPVTSVAAKLLLGGVTTALAISASDPQSNPAWLSHPALDRLPSSMRGVAEGAALAFTRSAKPGARPASAPIGPTTSAHAAGTGAVSQPAVNGKENRKKKVKGKMTYEEEMEYFLKPDMGGWRF